MIKREDVYECTTQNFFFVNYNDIITGVIFRRNGSGVINNKFVVVIEDDLNDYYYYLNNVKRNIPYVTIYFHKYIRTDR